MTTVRLAIDPFPHQRAAAELRRSNRFGVLVWHRRAGKTVFSCVELLTSALACDKFEPRFAYVAPTLRQAKDLAWPYLQDWAGNIPGAKINRSDLTIDVPNASGGMSRISMFGSDEPKYLRGRYFDGVVVDEVADMRPETWGEIIRPALADRRGWGLFIGTPKGVNVFQQLYEDAKRLEDWFADLRTVYDTDVIPPEEIENLRKSMGPEAFAQEFLCDFGASADNALLTPDDVIAAMQRVASPEQFGYAPKIVGVDVARYGSDQTVIFMRQGCMAFPPIKGRKADVVRVARAVHSVYQQWEADAVFVDEGGVGAGVVDVLLQMGVPATGVQFGASALEPNLYRRRREEMWAKMAKWVKEEGCLPPEERTLITELCAPRYSFDSSGRMVLESKEDLRKRQIRSPDTADALALTFAQPVASKRLADEVPVARRVANRYNPLEPWRRS